MLEFKNVTFSYGDKVILSSLSFSAKEGEVTGILGASGSGKTTILGLSAGLSEPKSGVVTPFSSEKTTFLFQENRLLPWFSVLQNLTVLGIPESRAKDYLAKVGLSEEENARPDSLSGGMKRRLALARTLAFGGDVFYLDEPLRELDIKTSGEILSLLRTELSGKTGLLITHDPAEAFSLCDRILLVGKRPLEILADVPKSRFASAEDLQNFLSETLA